MVYFDHHTEYEITACEILRDLVRSAISGFVRRVDRGSRQAFNDLTRDN